MDLKIRPCGPNDAAGLVLVGQATFLETYATMLPAADIEAHCVLEHSQARYADWLGKTGYRFWVAEVAETGAAVGYVMLSPPDLPVATETSDLEIKRIYMLWRFQGLGAGTRLLAVALERARQAGATRVLLGVNSGNAAALGFYRRHGFSQAGVRKFRVGANAYDDLVLARSI